MRHNVFVVVWPDTTPLEQRTVESHSNEDVVVQCERRKYYSTLFNPLRE